MSSISTLRVGSRRSFGVEGEELEWEFRSRFRFSLSLLSFAERGDGGSERLGCVSPGFDLGNGADDFAQIEKVDDRSALGNPAIKGDRAVSGS
jgi:hypothetical protein